MKLLLFIIGVYLSNLTEISAEVDSKQLKCLVCKAMLNELDAELGKVDSSLEMEIGGYRIDAEGNTIQKKVPLRRSEVHISDTLDSICDKMSDYVRATYKSNGQLTILNLLTPSGQMNPEMSDVDIIQDSDMNKSLQFYCQGIVEEHEESIVSLYTQEEQEDTKKTLCTDIARLCRNNFSDDDDESYNENSNDFYDEL